MKITISPWFLVILDLIAVSCLAYREWGNAVSIIYGERYLVLYEMLRWFLSFFILFTTVFFIIGSIVLAKYTVWDKFDFSSKTDGGGCRSMMELKKKYDNGCFVFNMWSLYYILIMLFMAIGVGDKSLLAVFFILFCCRVLMKTLVLSCCEVYENELSRRFPQAYYKLKTEVFGKEDRVTRTDTLEL